MTTTENGSTERPDIPKVALTWASAREWGSEGLTHRATHVLANGDELRFVVDSPRKGQWAARGWLNGDFKFYREDRTLKGAKAQMVDVASVMTAALAELTAVADGTGAVDPAVMEEAERQPVPDTVTLTWDSARIGDSLRRMESSFGQLAQVTSKGARAIARLRWHQVRQCSCPTPLHTMNCGHGARPVITGVGL